MNPLVVKVIIVVIIVGAGSASGYAAMKYYSSAQAPSLESFIPQDSLAVVHYQNDTVNVYAYSANNSVAAIQTIPMSSFFADLNSTAQNVTNNLYSGVTITSVGTYKGFQLFSVQLGSMNLINLVLNGFFGGNQPGVPSGLPSGLNLNLSTYQDQYLNSSTLYVSPITTSATLLGDSAAVYSGISASSAGNSFNYNKYIDPNANISLFANLTTTNLSTNYGITIVTANVSIGATTLTANATLSFVSSTARGNMDTALNFVLALFSSSLANNSITVDLNDVGSTTIVISVTAPSSIVQTVMTPASLPKS